MPTLGIEALTAGRPALRTERIEVPEWGGEVIIRELTGAERTQILEGTIDLYALFNRNGSTVPTTGAELRQSFEFMARIVEMTWITEAGDQVVTADQFDLLLQQDIGVISRLAQAALELSRLAPGSTDQAKKNSLTSQS